MSEWTPTAQHAAKQAEERNDRRSKEDTDTALKVLEIARDLCLERMGPERATKAEAAEVAAYAETLWQWVTTDTWPPAGGQQQ